VRFALDIRSPARRAAKWIACAVSAHECQDLRGIVRIWTWFAHTILRDVEQLFDLVGCSAGDVLQGTSTYRQLRMDTPTGDRIVVHLARNGPPPVLYRAWNLRFRVA